MIFIASVGDEIVIECDFKLFGQESWILASFLLDFVSVHILETIIQPSNNNNKTKLYCKNLT